MLSNSDTPFVRKLYKGYNVRRVYAARAINEANPSNVRMSGVVILFAVLTQIAFGIWTLLAQVPITLGLIHQGGALVVLAACVWHLHEICLAPQTGVSSAAQPI